MGTQQNADRGPIWADVRRLIDACEGRWGGVWTVVLRPRPARGGDGDLWIVCECTYPTGRNGVSVQQRVGYPYPTSDRTSMPSLVFRMLGELDGKLEDNSKLAKGQASF